ncbi:Tbc1 Domain Family Member 3L, partial [Manis pentadactyla]
NLRWPKLHIAELGNACAQGHVSLTLRPPGLTPPPPTPSSTTALRWHALMLVRMLRSHAHCVTECLPGNP